MSEARRAGLKHRAEYAAFRAVVAACGALGPERGPRAAEALGRAVYRRLRIRRDVVHANLRRAFPAADEAWIRATAEATYAHLAREALISFQLGDADAARIRALIRTSGLDTLRAALDEHGGAVVAMGHFGNWELGARSLPAFGIPTSAVVQRQRNPLFDRDVNRIREALGGEVIDRKVAPRAAMRALRSGRAVIFVIDQNAGRHGVFVPFFGVPASTHRGAGLMAVRAEVPFFAARCTRSAGGGYALKVERLGGRKTDGGARALTAAFTAWLEAEIRAAPEQYFWLHRRWKTRPPEEPPDV